MRTFPLLLACCLLAAFLISEILDRRGVSVVLLPRPRRFGKSLNLSMLRWFFEKRDENLWHLFEDLQIAQARQEILAHFQRHPVIYITFKDIKFTSFEETWTAIQHKIVRLYDDNRAVLDSGQLSQVEARWYQQIVDGTASLPLYARSLLDLSTYLHRVHGERVVILVDEYDAPIHSGYIHGYYQDVVSFFRAFFDAGLKGNEHLHKGVITGILRVAKESIFSGLNNLDEHTLLMG